MYDIKYVVPIFISCIYRPCVCELFFMSVVSSLLFWFLENSEIYLNELTV